MDANFKKFKKRVWFEILIKCLACGLAAGGLAVDAVFLPCKLLGIELFWLYYVLIGLGGFIIGGVVAFLIFRTDDKKIAMRLDRELNLNERVQTAYTFSGEQSDMHDLQRADTSAALGGVSVASLRFANLAAVILSGAIAVTGIAGIPIIANDNIVPPIFASKSEEPPEEPKYEASEWEWAALDELIHYVQTSKKADVIVKTGMLSELNGLKSAILSGVGKSALPNFVQNTVNNIRNVVKDSNERVGISEEQKDLNSSEESYVVNKLYEIFNIARPGGDTGGDDSGGGNSGGDDSQGKEDGDGGSGSPDYEVGGNDVPFFDPESGYTTASDRDMYNKYYEMVQRAFEEGTLSREEWEYIMATYFGDLSKDEKN